MRRGQLQPISLSEEPQIAAALAAIDTAGLHGEEAHRTEG
jgi:hypothetical protein